MLINKITPSVDYNKGLKRLDTQPNEPTNQNWIKVSKVVKPTNKKAIHLLVILINGLFIIIKSNGHN